MASSPCWGLLAWALASQADLNNCCPQGLDKTKRGKLATLMASLGTCEHKWYLPPAPDRTCNRHIPGQIVVGLAADGGKHLPHSFEQLPLPLGELAEVTFTLTGTGDLRDCPIAFGGCKATFTLNRSLWLRPLPFIDFVPWIPDRPRRHIHLCRKASFRNQTSSFWGAL